MHNSEIIFNPGRTIDVGRGATLTLRWASLTAVGVTAHATWALNGTPLETARIRLHSPAARAGFSLACRRRLKALAAHSTGGQDAGLAADVEGHVARLDAALVTLGIDLFDELAGAG